MAKLTKPRQCSKDFNLSIPYGSRSFQRIIDFYLFGCPVPDVSYRGKTLQDYGYSGSASFSRLKRRLVESAVQLSKDGYMPSKKTELDTNIEKAELHGLPFEYCVFLSNEERTVMASLFKAIRNSLAHGSFTAKVYKPYGRYYYFENFDGYKKAQLVLAEQTLLSWIDVIKEGDG